MKHRPMPGMRCARHRRSALVICASAVLAGGLWAMPASIASPDPLPDPPSDTPEYLQLVGVVRDFRERSDEGGHPDFEVTPDQGFGHYMGNVEPTLEPGGKPVFTGAGFLVERQWTDSQGRPIHPSLYDATRDDIAGEAGEPSAGGIQSAESFNQWYRDTLGVNTSQVLTLRLLRQSEGQYVFDDRVDPRYEALGGFFPIEDDLFGNPGGSPDRNFHFTFELHTLFTYHAADQQIFKFVGDDDVWVFIDGRLVIDISGVHAAIEQYVDLDRLGLTDGETYRLDFFFAERHRSHSNFRIETNLHLQNTVVPSISASYD